MISETTHYTGILIAGSFGIVIGAIVAGLMVNKFWSDWYGTKLASRDAEIADLTTKLVKAENDTAMLTKIQEMLHPK